ncbi:glycoside hydrolase family 127 protein [Actinobacteria bacterium YIM 96077]|uniref:Glycoside hydrolase family 127 protein n=1 Tax=Phytoactinopolyspora halophila TaxID=1981511 RepID=A0A329QUF6_9ACTN|nr:beta-L-arabinofuranosidase domain-containing protein [Phytoactinopolyspora halophila]AYY13801.1 glycoside hydrolase family 127 protein [Actinobacteria bacterium YIM 96077]RAW15656.1 glycoside hydrolase family 127 protein [Phytoactinopolyspora halophila]
MTVDQTATATDPSGGRPVVPTRSSHRPLGSGEIAFVAGFWAHLQSTNAAATLEHCEQWMERLGWLANLDHAADGTTGIERPGWSFSDSEVYKLIEAMSWEFGRSGDPAIDAAIRRLTARVGRAQDSDGYLNTYYGHPQRPPRYSDLETGHELYCAGHLLQAAVARLRTAGPDELVEIARRAADHVCDMFGPDGLQGIGGHPEIELGLVEFGRAVDESRYVEQARLFLDRRGHGRLGEIPFGPAYFQDDVPIRDAATWRGHAVRALYLSAAAVDVATEYDDVDLLAAVQRQWTASVARRTYITGGMGSRHQDESFGEDWELPADRAYCETCAGVASIMVSWRLYLATGDVRYADLIERTSFNIVATSPRSDGRAFFYANPLHQRVAGNAPDEDTVSPRAASSTRAPWFDVSCCPTNVARTLASWHTYAASVGERELTLLQYGSARVETTLGDGRAIGVTVDTTYPRGGTVTVSLDDPPAGALALRLRVPSWADGAVLDEGGRRRAVEPGLAVVDREFTPGEEIRLHLPMSPRFTWPDPRIDAVRGCVAVERGPLVYCLESIDLPDGVELDGIAVDPASQPVLRDHDRVEVQGRVLASGSGDANGDAPWPYQALAGSPDGASAIPLLLHPYHQWAERGPTAMRVWLPTPQPTTPR